MVRYRKLFLIKLCYCVFFFCASLYIMSLSSEHVISVVENFQILPYDKETFAYPLDINLSNVVERAIKNDAIAMEFAINVPKFKYKNTAPLCAFNSGEKASLMVLIKSAASNTKTREIIRKTWGSIRSKSVQVLFLLGLSRNITENRYIDKEAALYDDILQKDFIDSYRNNTLKTAMAIEWSVKFCSSAKFFLFIDDDHFANVIGIQKMLKLFSKAKRKRLWIGMRNSFETPNRDPYSPWRVTLSEYQFDLYPPYLAGGAFVMSFDVLQKFSFGIPFVKFLWIDDIYLGIVGKKLNLTPEGSWFFYSQDKSLYMEDRFVSHRGDHFRHEDSFQFEAMWDILNFEWKLQRKSNVRYTSEQFIQLHKTYKGLQKWDDRKRNETSLSY